MNSVGERISAERASDLCKRIIPCLDVAAGRTVKGVQFTSLRDVGDPVELAAEYERQGADELMFLDITASTENRRTMVDVVRRVANQLSIPFSVGGGVSSIDDAARLLESGADKVTVNTAAVRNPKLIADIASRYGSQCCVLAIDAKRVTWQGVSPTAATSPITIATTDAWTVLIEGGRRDTGLYALGWAHESIDLGAGEILLTSWDKDGTLSGFDLDLVRAFATSLPVPVIASGGAAGPQCFIDVFRRAEADAALAASIFHSGAWTVSALKEEIQQAGVKVRIC